jgi:hypothetical protein
MQPAAPPSVPQAVPPNAVLVHIGPHKTGTTTLQGAFHASRAALAKHGVRYAGPGRHPMLAVLALTETPGRRGDPPPSRELWDELVGEVRAASGERVVVSSEFFADASPDVVEQVVDDLGRDRVHVVVTLRPLARILPSQWQQYVQNGLFVTWADWLDRTLAKAYNGDAFAEIKPTPSFWNRHSHGDLVDRWAAVVGPENVTVVVLDESDREMLLRAFESLLDVPSATLAPDPDLTNRSLTAGEVELVRLLNEEFTRRNWNDALYGRFVRAGVAKKLLGLRRPDEDEPVVTMPRWGLERAADIGARAADQIRGSGVRVVGDLATLSELPPAVGPDRPPPLDPPIPASAAAIAVIGSILAGRKAVWPAPKKPAPPPPPKPPKPLAPGDRKVGSLSTPALLRVIGYRALRRLGLRQRGKT